MTTNGNEPIQGEVVHETALAVAKPDASLVLAPVMDIALAKKRLAEFQEFVAGYLKEDEDFGIIPGTAKPTLYKPGADKLCELYGLADTYRFAIPPVEDFKAEPPLFDYTIECSLWHRDRLVATGMGSCNSYESKYKFRDQQRICPICHKAAIIKAKNFATNEPEGWVCWKKRDGCGAKFVDGDKAIETQPTGKSINDDIATLKNTILKMAKKRAKIDATLSATRSSGVFTQDMEDIGTTGDGNGSGTKAAAQRVAEQKIAAHQEGVGVTGHVTDAAKHAKSSVKQVSVLMGDKDGKVYGQGLAELLALLDQHKPAWRADVHWDEAEMCQKIAGRAALVLQQFCETHGMKCEFVEKASVAARVSNSGGEPTEITVGASARPAETFGSQVASDLYPILTVLRTGKSQLWVKWGEVECSCFHRSLWPYLTAGSGKPADLIVAQSDKLNPQTQAPYINVEGIRKLGTRPYEGNKPVRLTTDIGAETPCF